MAEKSMDKFDDNVMDLAELMGYDKWPFEVAVAFDRARGVASLKWIKNRELSFASVVADYRAIEAEYVVRVGDNEENAQQVRRVMTEMLLEAAWDMDEPFETRQRYWNELQQLGFYRIERRCSMTWYFADSCHKYGQTELGLAVLDPLIAELERLYAEPTVTKQAIKFYDQELEPMRKLRAKLEAQKNGVESDDE